MVSYKTELSAAHYITVEAGNATTGAENSTASFTVRVAYSTNDHATAATLFEPPPPPPSRRTAPADDFDHTKGNITALTLGMSAMGEVQQWSRAFYSVGVADTQSELVCRVQCSR